MDGIRDLLRIGRVEGNATLSHEGSGSCKLRNNQYPMSFLLAGNVLERNEIHAVTCRSDKTGIGNGIQCRQFSERNGTMQIYDWCVIRSACIGG